MKHEQLNIFESEEFPADVAPRQRKPKKRGVRRKREAKKAPMLVDAFVPEIKEKSPHIFTVTEFTEKIKNILEGTVADVWITGEVTDYRDRTGRHLYFSIKDNVNKIRIVVFNASNRTVPFELKDGLEIVVHGKINVYGPQGYYSIIADYVEPKGIGALQLAFEQLKKKLEAEGLFNRDRKKPLPFLPKRIGVITSPTGAAIKDIVHVLTRRFPNIEILLYPVRVQGDGAAAEIAEAISFMNTRSDLDLLIFGRGGGSIEDLWCFNEEIVARAIAASKLPTISAVGHEIDFTIADFVADVRAATPSAAAEIAVPVKTDLLSTIINRRRSLVLAAGQLIVHRGQELNKLFARLGDPRKRLPDLVLRVDALRERLVFALSVGTDRRKQKLAALVSNLGHLSPLGVLAKGYAVVQQADGHAVSKTESVKINDELKIILHKGKVRAKVTKIID